MAVTANGFTVALGPGAVAMAATGGRDNRTQRHHIATIATPGTELNQLVTLGH